MLQTRFNFPAIYNPSNQTKEELIANFVVRVKEFNTIFDAVKKDEMKTPPQHFIIQGMRGSGKTTLLLRLFYAVADDKKLEKFLIPVIFDEEQYNIRTLFKFWEEIALYLEEEHESLFLGLYEDMQKYIEKVDYEEICFSLLQKRLQEAKRKLVLFIDNFGDMLAKYRKKERQRLREVLIQCNDIRIVGGSSVVLEFYYDYSEPFFEFFKVIPLEGLNQKETEELLLQLSETYKTETVKQIVKSNPGRIEALRRLTGGVPRTIILLFEIFLDQKKGDSFQDLEIILDRVTPLYKHRMDGLPSQKQDIIDTIALNWDAVGVKEIARNTRISSKAVSAHLNELEKNRIIVKIPTSTKNNFYQVGERFFNIWYLMRHGRKRERNKVLWLVRFLESWCSEDELIIRAQKHIKALKTGTIFEKHALYITEALADTKIPEEVQYQLIKDTREYLTQKNSPYIRELSKSDKELFDEAEKHHEANEFELSLKKLLKIRNKNPLIYFKIGNLYDGKFKIKDYKKAEHYYLIAAKHGENKAMNRLGILYENEFKDLNKAEYYYLMAAEKSNSDAMYNLARLYEEEFKDFKKAEHYYLMADENGDSDAMNSLANLYKHEYKDFKKAEQYYLMAIEKGHSDAMNNLGVLYMDEYKNFKKAEKYYLMAFKKGHRSAMYNLGHLYENGYKDFKKAEKYYLMAVEKGHKSAMYNLAYLYHYEYKDKDFKKAERYYLMAVDNEHSGAMNNLGVLYNAEFNDFKKAEEYYLMAVEKEKSLAMTNLGSLYEIKYKNFRKAEYYYLMAVEKGQRDAMFNLALMYEKEYKDFKKAEHYYLMAVEKEDSGAMQNLALLYFDKKRNKFKALNLAKDAFEMEKDSESAGFYSIILLWNDEIEEALKLIKVFMENEEEILNNDELLKFILMFLLAKRQYHFTYKLFKENKFEIKDKFKPIYYALIYFMRDIYPDEYKKMGPELKQTVEEIINTVNQMSIDYK